MNDLDNYLDKSKIGHMYNINRKMTIIQFGKIKLMDLKNIGLSEKMDIKLKEITSEYFLNELDGYRFAVSLAIL